MTRHTRAAVDREESRVHEFTTEELIGHDARVREEHAERIIAALLAIPPMEWLLAGAHARTDAVEIVKGVPTYG